MQNLDPQEIRAAQWGRFWDDDELDKAEEGGLLSIASRGLKFVRRRLSRELSPVQPISLPQKNVKRAASTKRLAAGYTRLSSMYKWDDIEMETIENSQKHDP